MEKLKQLVKDSGGQLKFARSIGVSQGAISFWVLGKREIKLKHAAAILQVYQGKIAIDDLISDKAA